jgi:hypothetical protein
MRWNRGRGLFQRQGNKRTPISSAAACASTDGFLGPPRQGMESWQQGGLTYYRVTGPLSEPAGQRISLPRRQGPGETPLCDVRRSPANRALLQTLKDYTRRRTMCGASSRAIASRISRSTC